MIIEQTVSVIDYILESSNRRHVVGGVLLSASFLFAGLAITVMTMTEDSKKRRYDDE